MEPNTDRHPETDAAPGDAGTSTEQIEHELPEISDEALDRIENVVFHRIGEERARTGRRRRRTAWISASAAAAVIVVAAVIAPSVQAGLSGGSAGSVPAVDTAEGSPVSPEYSEDGATSDDSAGGGVADGAGDQLGDPGAISSDPDAAREIITTASVAVTVDDVRAGADAITALANDVGGWVESLQLGSISEPLPIESQDVQKDAASATYGWISIRVPADDLQATVTALSEVGDVTGVDISRQDVTDIAIDTRARIDSLQASVTRLTELMEQSASVGDLIAAETALSERQAELESYQQQLEQLEGQVEMSTLSVNLTKANVAVEADPAGFGDGLVAGWNGLVATLNGIVIALGFLVPWIVVVGVLVAIVWFIVRLVRRRRTRSAAKDVPADAEA